MLTEVHAAVLPRSHFNMRVKVGIARRWRTSQGRDELMRRWEEVNEDEQEITVMRSEGRRLQVEKVQSWYHRYK